MSMRLGNTTARTCFAILLALVGTLASYVGVTRGPDFQIGHRLRANVENEVRFRIDADGEHHPYDQPDEAMQYWGAQRLPPGGTTLPLERLFDAKQLIDQQVQMRAARRATAGATGPGGITSWDELGPGNVGGRTRAFVIDPVNPDILYAAGAGGGVFKSTNAGASWVPLDDFMFNIAVCALAIDPNNSNILYAGTGEGFGATVTYRRGLGIFKSTDAGATWNQLASTSTAASGEAFYYVNDLIVSPNDSNRIYAATRYGMFRSLDAGATWTIAIGNPNFLSATNQSNGCRLGCLDLAVRTDTAPDVIFASFGSFDPDALFRSQDGGDTWTEFSMPATQGRMKVAIAPSNNDIMYLCMAGNMSTALGSIQDVFRSVDGGDTWQPRINFGPAAHDWLLGNLPIGVGCFLSTPYHQGWHDMSFVVDPVNPDVVWIGGIDLFRSDDGGANWGIASYHYTESALGQLGLSYVHPDQHALHFHPGYDGVTNQTLYAVNDGGLFRTDSAMAATGTALCAGGPAANLPGIAWTGLNHDYAVTQFYHGDSAATADIFVAGAQDNGTNLVGAADRPNSWQRIYDGDGGYVAIDPTNENIIYAEIQFFPQIVKSVNGGAFFSRAVNGITDTDGLFITPFAMDPSNPQVLWTGGSRPWRTTNGAASWSAAGPDLVDADRISAIAIAPSNGNVVYLGFNNGFVVSNHTANSGRTWITRSVGLSAGFVSSMAVDPVDPDIAYLTYSNYGISHVRKTIDGGATWTPIDGTIVLAGVPDVPAHWVAVRPCDSDQLYVGTEVGVFASDDGGAVWESANAGLSNVVVETLDFQNRNMLVAFTHGRGAFRAELAPCANCPADGSGDGEVGIVDFLAILARWGSCPAPCANDADQDGVVGVTDFLAVLAGWGTCPGGQSNSD